MRFLATEGLAKGNAGGIASVAWERGVDMSLGTYSHEEDQGGLRPRLTKIVCCCRSEIVC